MAPASSSSSRRGGGGGASPPSPSGYRYVNQQHYYTSLQQALHPGQPVPPPYSLANTRESFRDLLAFEERLKQNAARLAYQRRKYEAFLLSLILTILVLAYRVVLLPSPYTLVQFANSGFLLIGIVTLILFFATGVYTEKIAYAYKFVPQANRALRYYNIYLNTKQPPRQWSLNPFKLFRGPPSASGSSDSSPSSGSTTQLVARSNSLNSTTSAARPGRSRGNGSSPSSPTGSRSVPLAPIPPSSNPRGELIFSSKVTPPFREGYERYRTEWERRRKPSKYELGWYAYLKSFVVRPKARSSASAPAPAAAASGEKGKAELAHTESSSDRAGARADQASGSWARSTSGIAYLASSPSEASEDDSSSAPGVSGARGRDTRTRPLMRSNSSSSVSSAGSHLSFSPPSSRRPSPLRDTLAGPGPSSRHSSTPSTPELVREEDEYFHGSSSSRSLRSHGRGLTSASESSLASGREARRAGSGASSPGESPRGGIIGLPKERLRSGGFGEFLRDMQEEDEEET